MCVWVCSLLGLDCRVLIHIRCYYCVNASDLASDNSYELTFPCVFVNDVRQRVEKGGM